MLRIKKKIEEYFNFGQKYCNVSILTNLLYLIFSVAHLIGCSFVFIGFNQNGSEETWIKDQELDEQVTK